MGSNSSLIFDVVDTVAKWEHIVTCTWLPAIEGVVLFLWVTTGPVSVPTCLAGRERFRACVFLDLRCNWWAYRTYFL